MFTVGVDPDLHTPALALLEDGRCRNLVMGRVDRSVTGAKAVAEVAAQMPRLVEDLLIGFSPDGPGDYLGIVEGQQFYGSKNRSRPEDLINLAQTAGVAAGVLAEWKIPVIIPLPREWKGSIPKKVKQKRILNKLGWSSHEGRVVVPAACPLDVNFAPSKWTHAIDAIGLAQWGEKVRARRSRNRP